MLTSTRALLSSVVVISAALLGGVACDSKESEPAAQIRSDAPAQAAGSTEAPEGQASVEVLVTAQGYEPSRVEAKAGQELILTFKRTTDEGCGDRLVFAERGIEKDLPLNEPVVVRLTPKQNETIGFTCGMGMYEGSVVVTL